MVLLAGVLIVFVAIFAVEYGRHRGNRWFATIGIILLLILAIAVIASILIVAYLALLEYSNRT